MFLKVDAACRTECAKARRLVAGISAPHPPQVHIFGNWTPYSHPDSEEGRSASAFFM
jgi:hypothetical protein